MKILDKYQIYKCKYPKFVILIKVGNFYEAYGEEAYIMMNLFNYNIRTVNDTVRVGFPVISYNKVIDKFNAFKINYIVCENENIIKKKFNHNNYDKYISNDLSIDDRIIKIYEKLKIIKNNSNIDEILLKVESIL